MNLHTLAIGLTAALVATSVGAAPRETERQRAYAERPTKPTGPIAVEYRLAGEPAIGVPLTVIIVARAVGAVGTTIAVTASRPEALQLSPPEWVSAEAERFEWTITVVPLAPDAGFVNVLVAAKIDGVDQARSIAIPLRVASAPAAASEPTANGESLIALPVDEAP